jgi:hypothetical protein
VDERGLKNAMRLLAVEHVLTVLLATECVEAGDDPMKTLELLRQGFIGAAQRQAFAGLDDPAISDLASSEFEEAVDRLLSMTKAKLEQRRR